MLALDANFRSAPQVVAGINFIFEQLMTPALGDTAYGDGQPLPVLHFTARKIPARIPVSIDIAQKRRNF